MAPEARHGPPSLPGLGSPPAALQPRPQDLGTRCSSVPPLPALRHTLFPRPKPWAGAACFVHGWSRCQSTAGPSKCPPGRGRAGGRCGVVSQQATTGSREGSAGTMGPSGAPGAGAPGRVPPEFSRLVLWLQTLRFSGQRKELRVLPLTVGSVRSCTLLPLTWAPVAAVSWLLPQEEAPLTAQSRRSECGALGGAGLSPPFPGWAAPPQPRP